MESGPSAHSRATIWSRVSSPSAAKIGALSCNAAEACGRKRAEGCRRRPGAAALRLRDMASNVVDLFGPTAFVHPERLGAARHREVVEPGFHDRETCTTRHVFERELDEGH